MKRLPALFGTLALCQLSFGVFFETEPNDSAATANVVIRGDAPWADVGLFNLGVDDADWVRVHLNAGEFLTAITTPLGSPESDDPDTIMALISPDGLTVLDSSDDIDDSDSLGSALQYFATESGDYYLAIAGFGPEESDLGSYLSPDSDEEGNYALTLSIVPEPSTLAAIALGAGLLLRKRRRI